MTYEAWRISYQSSEQAARAAYAECERLWAKAESMEQQKPVEWQTRTRPAWNDGTWGPWRKCSEEYAEDIKKTPLLHDWLYEARALYALPGAQNVPKAVAYLDIGAGGYMDIGTDLTGEELATLPKGRHMLGIVGTYGIEGYVPAQPAPSVPECPYPCGWQRLLKYAMEDGAYLARSINEDEPVTDKERAVTMRVVLQLRAVLLAIINAALEAKP